MNKYGEYDKERAKTVMASPAFHEQRAARGDVEIVAPNRMRAAINALAEKGEYEISRDVLDNVLTVGHCACSKQACPCGKVAEQIEKWNQCHCGLFYRIREGE